MDLALFRWMTGTTLPLIAAALLLTAGLTGCGGDETPSVDARGPQLEVTNVALGSSLRADKRVSKAQDSFRPSDRIYVSIDTEGDRDGELAVVWTYEDDQVVQRDSRRIGAAANATTEFHIEKPDGWPAGEYEVAVLVDGREVESREFEVESR